MIDDCCAIVRHITTVSSAQTVKDLEDKISCAMPAPERHHSRRAQYFDLSPKHDKHKSVTLDEPTPVIEHLAPAPSVTDAEPAAVIGYVAPAPSVTYTAPSPTTEYVALAPTVSYTTPAPVIEHIHAPVIEYIALPTAVFILRSINSCLPLTSMNPSPVWRGRNFLSLLLRLHRCKLSFRKFLRFRSWSGFRNKLLRTSK